MGPAERGAVRFILSAWGRLDSRDARVAGLVCKAFLPMSSRGHPSVCALVSLQGHCHTVLGPILMAQEIASLLTPISKCSLMGRREEGPSISGAGVRRSHHSIILPCLPGASSTPRLSFVILTIILGACSEHPQPPSSFFLPAPPQGKRIRPQWSDGPGTWCHLQSPHPSHVPRATGAQLGPSLTPFSLKINNNTFFLILSFTTFYFPTQGSNFFNGDSLCHQQMCSRR